MSAKSLCSTQLVQHPKARASFHFISVFSLSEHASDHTCWCVVLYFSHSKQQPPLFFFMPVGSKTVGRGASILLASPFKHQPFEVLSLLTLWTVPADDFLQLGGMLILYAEVSDTDSMFALQRFVAKRKCYGVVSTNRLSVVFCKIGSKMFKHRHVVWEERKMSAHA